MIDINKLLEKTDLVTIAERYGVSLRRYGDDYRGRCPIHGGQNATAFVIYTSGERQHWHSYTEDLGGDALDLVMRLDGVGFVDAAQKLADLAGIAMPGMTADESAAYRAQRERVQREQTVMQLAANFYRKNLSHSTEAQGWLQGRGFNDLDAIAENVGLSNGKLRAYLQERDVDLRQAMELGLLVERTNGDTYLVDAIPQGYLVYIHQLHGRVTYMSGRSIETNEPERKMRNLHAPKRPFWMRQKRAAPLLIVEGQACALTGWLWGFNAVALAGKSLDDSDLRAIRSYDGVYLCLDDDFQYRDIARVADQTGSLTMICKPRWHDLNDGLQDGATAEKLHVVMGRAIPWIESAINYAAAIPPFKLQGELEHLARLVADLPQGTRGRYVGEICSKRKLATRADFMKLVQARTEEESEANGYGIEDGRLVLYGDPLGNWHATITHELTLDDGLNMPSVQYTVTGALDTGVPLPTLELSAEEFAGMKWINRSWGARPITYLPPSKGYLLQRAIQEVSQFDLRRERVHTYTGWATIDGEKQYLTTSGALHAGGHNPDVRVDLGINNLGRYALPAPPQDPRSAIWASMEFLKLGPLRVTLPLWLAMYAAPLGPVQTLDAVVWVYGTTQSGKSTITHLALSHFGRFISGHKYHAPIDWISTVTAIEGALFAVKDAPVIIDDYAPQNGSPADARALGRAAQRVIRSVGNRAARGRARADLTEQRNRPPRGLVIATAENPILGQSTVGRTVYVPVEPGEIIRTDSADLDRAQQWGESGLYSQAMSGYVCWLAERWGQLENEMPEQVRTDSQIARQMMPAGQGRLSDYYAVLINAARQAFAYARDRGALDTTQEAVWLEQSKTTLLALLSEQGKRVSAESPVAKFWTAMQDLVAQDDIVFHARKFPVPVPEHKTLGGWYDDEHIYLLTNTVLSAVKRYWSDLGESLDVLSDAFRRMLSQQGYVARRAEGQMERKTYINTEVGRVRTLWLDRAAVSQRAGFTVGEDAYQEEN